MSVKRKDNKGRILRDGEIQKADGRYEFRYQDAAGVRRSLYSWRFPRCVYYLVHSKHFQKKS